MQSETASRDYLQIAVKELPVSLCLKAVWRDEELPSAAGYPVSGLDIYLVIARLQL